MRRRGAMREASGPGGGAHRASQPSRAHRARATLGLLVLGLAAGCGGPVLFFPGGALSGEVVAEPVDDWSFVDDAFVDLELRPGDPYSVQVNYVVRDGALYIDPAEGRRWFALLQADDRVRVRLGGRVYPVRAVLVGRPGELEGFDPERFVYRLESRPAEG